MSCLVKNCSSKDDGLFKLYPFPRDVALIREWLKCCGYNHNTEDEFKYNDLFICSVHFDNSAFADGEKLNFDALPTLHLATDYLESTSKSQKSTEAQQSVVNEIAVKQKFDDRVKELAFIKAHVMHLTDQVESLQKEVDRCKKLTDATDYDFNGMENEIKTNGESPRTSVSTSGASGSAASTVMPTVVPAVPSSDDTAEEVTQPVTDVNSQDDVENDDDDYDPNGDQSDSVQNSARSRSSSPDNRRKTRARNKRGRTKKAKRGECICPNCIKNEIHRRSGGMNRLHMRHVCPVPACGKEFTARCNLLTHQVKHVGDRPYTCMDCGYAFPRDEQLQEHRKTHTEDFACSQCDKKFIRSDHLYQHKKIHKSSSSHGSKSESENEDDVMVDCQVKLEVEDGEISMSQ